jgi:hypothetical protein
MNAENAEKNIWDQIRSLTMVQVRLCQWGVTTLVGLETAIVFIRKDYIDMLKLPSGTPLLPRQQLVGTFVLFVVAFMFFMMSRWISHRLLYYMEALRKLPQQYPGVDIRIYPEIPQDRSVRYYPRILYFFFPCFDLFLYVCKVMGLYFSN